MGGWGLLSLVAAAAAALVLPAPASGDCIHDHITDTIESALSHDERRRLTSSPQPYEFTVNEQGRAMQTATYSPIRIKVDVSRLYDGADGQFACMNAGDIYIPTLAKASTDRATCTAGDVITEEKRAYLRDVLVPQAVAFYTQSLSVRPVAGNLTLPYPMPDYACFADGSFYYNLVCCDRNFPQALRTVGIPNADYLLVVTARPTAGSVLAWATECQSDQYARPLCGHANISPARMSMSSKDLPNQISVVTHEIGHALGFSSSKYGSFRKPGTLARVDSLTDVLSTTFDTTLGKVVKRIVTPKVVSFVKSHYNCDNWPNAGGEIEDYGGSGTAGSHWEKRLVMNELMNPVSEPYMVKSGLTLSYFEDSGWYSVDYSIAERLPWGENQGCDFVRKKCSDGWSPFYFCRTVNENGCTADMRYQGQCNLDNNPYVTYPANYQYFPGNTGMGGKQPHTDYCPYYQLFSTRDCTDPSSIAYFFYGERPGSGSRCFMGTYQLRTVTAAPAMHGGCVQTACSSLTNLIEVTLTGTPATVVNCPKDGGTVDLSTLPNSNFVGTLLCPPAKQLCRGDPCDVQDCSGHGRCNAADGSCTCSSGYYGPDAYSCPWRTCPTRINGTVCSGHGFCNKLTGACEDGAGNAGCYPGWSEADCGRQGCPKVDGVECAGKGTCASGVCTCDAGFIGSDCALTDCPGSPRCSDDGSGSAGTCDTSLGLCTCADGFDSNARPFHRSGADCSAINNGTRPYATLSFSGETNPATNGTYGPILGTLRSKEYAYFQFNVPTTQFPIVLTLTSRTQRASVTPPPFLTASYSTTGRPTATSYDFGATRTLDGGKTVAIEFAGTTAGGGGTAAFSKTGTILVAVLQNANMSTLDYTLELTRDGCAVMQCGFGYCTSGRCVCDFGWSGTLCSEPDCPGTPDCGGQRGTCTIPAAAYTQNGTAVRGAVPTCACDSAFLGTACEQYQQQPLRQTGAGMSLVMDGLWNTRSYVDALTGSEELWLKNDGTGSSVLNATYRGTLASVDPRSQLLIDPDALAAERFGLNGSLGFYARLSFEGTPDADGMFMTQTLVPPQLDSYRDFDARAWRSAARVQEISTTVSQLTFGRVFNGAYAKSVLAYTLYIELTPGCPPAIRGCSGHGTCSRVCECDVGWEGVRCDTPVPLLDPATAYETNELLPGQWQFFLYRPSDSPDPAVEVSFSLTRVSPSAASWPLMVAAWDTGRFPTSIGKLLSEAVVYDHAAVVAHNGTQAVTVRRSNPATQKWLYLGVRNLPAARASFVGSVTVSDRSTYSMRSCLTLPPAVCRATRCNGNGAYTEVRGVPTCECDYGWNEATACASPIFSSFSSLVYSAQSVGFLCSVCKETGYFPRDSMALYKIPQPLLKSTGLTISVRPVEYVATAAEVRAYGLNGTRVFAQGHPSLLVSASLPRSMLDFLFIESGQTANQSLLLTEASPTGNYWAVAYANTPGAFLVSAQRSKIPVPPAVSSDNLKALGEWLAQTTAGHVVLGVGGALMFITLLSCLAQCCCGRVAQLSRVQEKMDQMEEEHARMEEQAARSLERIKALDPAKLAETPTLARALTRHKSMLKARSVRGLGDNLLAAASGREGGGGGGGGGGVLSSTPPAALPSAAPVNFTPYAPNRPTFVVSNIMPQTQAQRQPQQQQPSLLMQSMASNAARAAEMNAQLAAATLRPGMQVLQLGGGGGAPSSMPYSQPQQQYQQQGGAGGGPQTAADLRAALRAAAQQGGNRPAPSALPGAKKFVVAGASGGGGFTGVNPMSR